MSTNNNFLSTAFQHFTGVVEDVNDPEQLGRVRVRCFGFHNANLKIVPRTALPWATVAQPTTSAGISGIGTSPHGLVSGSWVFGFFRDGMLAQDPIILSVIASQYTAIPEGDVGFKDPDSLYPKLQGESLKDINLLATGTNTVPDVVDGVIGNPLSAYAAVYPSNSVTETVAGHIIEVDSTAGAERIRVVHASGSFFEMHPDGSITYSNKDKWAITTGDDKAHITGSVSITVDGSTTLNCSSTTVNGNVSINGNANISGELVVGGTSTASDHLSNGISGSGHTHTSTPVGSPTSAPTKS